MNKNKLSYRKDTKGRFREYYDWAI